MQREKIVEILTEELRTNTALRHKLGIDGAADPVSGEEGEPVEAVVFTDRDGEQWALAVLGPTE